MSKMGNGGRTEQTSKRSSLIEMERCQRACRCCAACCRRYVFVLYIRKIVENINESVYNKNSQLYTNRSVKNYPMLARRLPH
ncbi:hypothetical protein LR69_03675 [Geobacillus sp. BCO2]|nr:hypothetical protein LR69_03675 [Geobacillus sp. BCO2]